MATKKDLSFLTQSNTTRLEAAANEKAKREAELQEMRRLRAEAGGSGVNWDNGAAPITDLEAWRNSQKNASEEERRKKMEAAEGLHGYRGKDVPEGTKKKARDSKVFKPWEGKGGNEGEVVNGEDGESEAHEEEVGGVNVHEMAGKFENVTASEQGADDMRDDEAGEVEQTEEQVVEKEQVVEEPPVSEEEPAIQEEEPPVEPEIATPPSLVEEPAPVVEEPIPQPEPEPVVEQPPQPVLPPTYSRTDVKFSFGLIVRSNHPTGTFENLLDNETLRKCMASTSKILIKEMPSPPTVSDDENVDYSTFPKAYYDPSLEPTVLSIEEDEKNTTEMMEKGNKRTLVKASFPVFLVQDGESGDKVLLKETKSTVFQALRAAVSGGQFLR